MGEGAGDFATELSTFSSEGPTSDLDDSSCDSLRQGDTHIDGMDTDNSSSKHYGLIIVCY